MPEGIHHRCLGGPDGVVGVVVAVSPAIEDAENNRGNGRPVGNGGADSSGSPDLSGAA
jgi:hypothetical protein